MRRITLHTPPPHLYRRLTTSPATSLVLHPVPPHPHVAVRAADTYGALEPLARLVGLTFTPQQSCYGLEHYRVVRTAFERFVGYTAALRTG